MSRPERSRAPSRSTPPAQYLYGVGELSDSLTSRAIDSKTGAPAKLKQYPMGKNPTWIEIVDLA
jgi:6-phosphogluconolactonase